MLISTLWINEFSVWKDLYLSMLSEFHFSLLIDVLEIHFRNNSIRIIIFNLQFMICNLDETNLNHVI